jgi:hypothetical protein
MFTIDGTDLDRVFIDTILYDAEVIELLPDGFTDVRRVTFTNGSQLIVQTKPDYLGGYHVTRIEYRGPNHDVVRNRVRGSPPKLRVLPGGGTGV